MKRILKTISMVLVIVFSVSFTGCEVLEAAAGVVEIIDGIGDLADDINPDREYKKAAKKAVGRKPAVNELYKGTSNPSPFNNHAYDRLLRRTSELTGGTPVDVSQYLVHSESFAIMDDDIKFCRFMLEGLGKQFKEKDYIYEYDITVTFEVNKQQYQMDLTAVTARSKSWITAGDSFKYGNVYYYIANKKGLNVKDIKKRKVKFNNTRKSKSKYIMFSPVYYELAEPCYYQFDVEVEYQREYYPINIFKKIGVNDFAAFNKIYRSDLYTEAGAAIDVQRAIWEDADKLGELEDYPHPIVNFVRAAKYTQ